MSPYALQLNEERKQRLAKWARIHQWPHLALIPRAASEPRIEPTSALEREPRQESVNYDLQAWRSLGCKYPTVKNVMKLVSHHYQVSLIDLQSIRRTQNVVLVRQVAMFLARHVTPYSLPQIGMKMGGRDHTTVLHAIRKITKLVETDPVIAMNVGFLMLQLSPEGERD